MWFHHVPLRNTLKSLLVRSPAPERQVGRGCFGQCSGKEGTGLNRAAVEHILERALSGACGRKEERKENFSGWVFCSFKSANCHWSPLGMHIFESRTTKLRGVSKLVLGHLSSRNLVSQRKVSQNLLVWPFGLSQDFSVLTPPTSRSCPRKSLGRRLQKQ